MTSNCLVYLTMSYMTKLTVTWLADLHVNTDTLLQLSSLYLTWRKKIQVYVFSKGEYMIELISSSSHKLWKDIADY
jgi:hypothetical protein